jgi:nicotinamide-nucleotide adenylyltransferase
MSICVFPGKFQPFHNGHMMVVKGMVKMCDRLVIVICCGKQGDDIFTSEEVREMVSSALLDEDILDAEIHVLNDCPTNDEWVDRLKEVGEGQEIQVWSGREDILEACDKSGIKTKKIVHVPGHDSDDIRGLITGKKDGWESKVPHSVASVIRSKAR